MEGAERGSMGRWRSVMHARSATKRDEPGPRSPGPGQLRAISIRFWPRCKGVSPLFLAGVEACQREVPGPESGFEKGCTRGTQSQSLRPRPEPEPGSFSGKNIFDHLWVQNWPILGSYAVGASGGLVSPPPTRAAQYGVTGTCFDCSDPYKQNAANRLG